MIGDEKASNVIGTIKSNLDDCVRGSIGWNVLTKLKSESSDGSCSSGSDSTY